MATRIRLRRTGKKKQAYYRFVVADSRSPRDGRFIEILGNYNPHTDPPEITIDEERTLYWLKTGAQPSNTARSLLSKKGILKRLAEERPDHPLLKKPVRRGRRPEVAPEEPEAVEVVEAPVEPEEAAVEETAEAEAAEVVEETAEAEALEVVEETAEAEAVEVVEETAEAEAVEVVEETAEAEAVEDVEEAAEAEAVEVVEETAEAEAGETGESDAAADEETETVEETEEETKE